LKPLQEFLDSKEFEDRAPRVGDFLDNLHERDKKKQAFVGVWPRLDGNGSDCIKPFWNLPFSAMLEECLQNPDFCASVVPEKPSSSATHFFLGDRSNLQRGKPKHKNWLFSFDHQAPPVEVDASTGELGRQFAALAFVSELRRLLLRKHRLTYETQTRTLGGKIKGKLKISQTVRRHHLRGRLDLAECDVPIRTLDNRVNRIFRYTLKICKQVLVSTGNHFSWAHIHFCNEILSSVAEIDSPRLSDYHTHGLTGFYKEHAHLLTLAKILQKNHVEAFSSAQKDKKIKTVPFLMNTALVFESWVTVRSLQIAKDNGWKLVFPQKTEDKLGSNFPGFKPDLLFEKTEAGNGVEKRFRILDVKYKKFWQVQTKPGTDTDYRSMRSDLHQILAYKAVFSAERVGLVFPSEGGSFRQQVENHSELLYTIPLKNNQKIEKLKKSLNYLIKSILK
jgi:5-methylcytosine-specific restriction endonuclease McrBC regulatory subunit McrC